MIMRIGAFDETCGKYYFEQLLSAVHYMHSKDIVHCDLKPENILVDANLDLKIADFGLATNQKVNKLRGWRGSRIYTAPEIHEGKIYDGKKADIFALGVILFVIVHGKFPFQGVTENDFHYNLIKKGELEEYWEKVKGQHLTPQFKDLFLRMVSYDPKERPSIEEIC